MKIIDGSMYQKQYELLRTESFKGVFIASKGLIDYYNQMDIEREPMILSKETLINMNIVMYLKKGSALRTPLDEQLLKIKENGIRAHFENDYRLHEQRRIERQKIPEQMTMHHLQGTFHVCAVLYGISLLIFIGEVFVGYIERLN